MKKVLICPTSCPTGGGIINKRIKIIEKCTTKILPSKLCTRLNLEDSEINYEMEGQKIIINLKASLDKISFFNLLTKIKEKSEITFTSK